tara:strand:+ start:551 stop:1132 length:582 start_codon:yes stop_codon:yes gene_type:complete
MDNFDLRKYLAEGRLLKEEIKFIDYVTVDQDEFKAQYDKHYDDYGNDEDFVEEYGLDFLSPNMEKINKYYGAKVLEKDVRDDFFIGDGLEFISSNEKFEKWLDRNKEFYLGEGKLLKEDGLSKLLLKVLKAYQPEVEQQLGTKLANWKLDDMDDASATDVDGSTGFSFKIADDTDPEIIDLANKKIAVIKYNL